MEPITLRKQIDESTVVHTLVEVHKIRKISKEQLNDILSVQPNYLPPVVKRANEFLEKLAHLTKMYKLQDVCSDYAYAKKHPDHVQAVEEYFKKEGFSDKCGDDIVALGCIYEAIGKFCISTKKFFKEIAGTPGETRSQLIANILETLDDDLAEREQDMLDVNRYAFRFFKKLIEKNKKNLPRGISADEMIGYMKMYIYDDELNR